PHASLILCTSLRALPLGAPLFPYTTLFRSVECGGGDAAPSRGDLQAGVDVAQVPAVVAAGVLHSGGQDSAAAVFDRSDEVGEDRSEEHTSELQSRFDLVCRLLLDKKNGPQV